jgi:hypothetical protein
MTKFETPLIMEGGAIKARKIEREVRDYLIVW